MEGKYREDPNNLYYSLFSAEYFPGASILLVLFVESPRLGVQFCLSKLETPINYAQKLGILYQALEQRFHNSFNIDLKKIKPIIKNHNEELISYFNIVCRFISEQPEFIQTEEISHLLETMDFYPSITFHRQTRRLLTPIFIRNSNMNNIDRYYLYGLVLVNMIVKYDLLDNPKDLNIIINLFRDKIPDIKFNDYDYIKIDLNT